MNGLGWPTRVVVVGTLLFVALGCGSGARPSEAASTRSVDKRLAGRVSPTAADLGAPWKRRSAAQVHDRGGCVLLLHASACATRFFALPGAPPSSWGASAIVYVFPNASRAAQDYTTTAQGLSATRTIDSNGVHETISLRARSSIASDGAHATLFVYRVAMTSPRRLNGSERTILMREGRAELVLTYTTGRPVAFKDTARRLAARMRPALP